MIFYTNTPCLAVNSKIANRTIARFDKDGKFETDNPILIEKLKPHFRHRLKGESKKKGKTYEDMYGKKKSREIKLKMSKNRCKTLKEVR